MIFVDRAEHTRLRKVMNKGVSQPSAQLARLEVHVAIFRTIQRFPKLHLSGRPE
jgi:cytochrome P450